MISTLTAKIAGYNREDIQNGLYGFNGTLEGIAAGVFLQLSLPSLLLMAAASCLSTWMAGLFNRQRLLPGFTSPFILSVWILLLFCTWVSQDLLLPSEDVLDIAADRLRVENCLQAFVCGIGQVMFQCNLWTGLCFLTAIFINSRTAAFYTIVGALLPIPFAWWIGMKLEALSMGLAGYNGVLCAIALGDKSRSGFVWASISILLSVVLQFAGMQSGIITLTAPFVLSVWITMGMRKIFSFMKATS